MRCKERETARGTANRAAAHVEISSSLPGLDEVVGCCEDSLCAGEGPPAHTPLVWLPGMLMSQDKAPGWGPVPPTMRVSLHSHKPQGHTHQPWTGVHRSVCKQKVITVLLDGLLLLRLQVSCLSYPPGMAWTAGQEKLVAHVCIHPSTWVLARDCSFPMWCGQRTQTGTVQGNL